MSRSAEPTRDRFTSESDRRTRPATALATLLALAALARLARLTLADLPLPGTPGGRGERMQDFRDATYYPVRELLRSGGMPYDPATMFAHWPVVQEFDLYLPAHLWLSLPLALPGYRSAATMMLALDAVLLALLARWACRWVDAPAWAWPALTAALLLGQVGKSQLYLGQVNPLVAVGVAGSLGWRDRPRLSAACLALAWIKPQFGLPLTVLLLARGRTRTALTGTLLALLASLPVLAVLLARTGGPAGLLAVMRRNLDYATATGYGAVDSLGSVRIDLVATVSRALLRHPPGSVEVLAAVLVLAAAGVLLRRAEADGARSDPLVSAAADLLTVLVVMVAVVHQPGDTLAAVPAAVGVTAAVLRRDRAVDRSRAIRWLPAAALTALAVPHAHLYVVTRWVTEAAGARADTLVDAVAVMLATVLTALWLATAPAVLRRPRAPMAAA